GPRYASYATTNHSYRHGLVPSLTYYRQHKSEFVQAASANDLNYGGGISGIGVLDGHEQVYLIFWGSQWGSESTNSSGYDTFSGDPSGVAPDLQAFFKGLGTGNETWSGVMTQYCQGVASGTQICPTSSTQHVGYPTGGALAGVWEDTSASEPAAASGHQIGVEAVAAASHFGNTTSASQRDAVYVVVSATGTDPDNYQSQGFCAWHDYTGDSTLSGGAVNSSVGALDFTNLPYIPDAGASCGAGFVNPGNNLDGVTIVEGHEYAETVTDQFPAGGYTDSSGAENGDKCAWISSGQGASQNISLTTGTFAVQSTWANDFNNDAGGCEVSHAIVGNGGSNTVTVNNPGNQTTTVGNSVSLQITGSDSGGLSLSYSASGLPAGLSISSSGLVSGTPTTAGSSSVTVTASDSTGATGNTSFTWTVNPKAGNTVTVTNPGNQSTTVGTAVSLQIHASDSATGQTLTYSATGLPAGLSINSSSGLISGTPTTVGTSSASVTAKDTTGASGSASFSWAINSSGGSCTAKQLLGNPGFETGSASPWRSTAGVINPNGAGETAHSGTYYAWLDGYGTPHTDTLSQGVSISSGCHTDTFSFWLHIDTSEASSSAIDTLKVQVLSSTGSVLATLATYSNLSTNFDPGTNNGYAQVSFSVSAYSGQTITVKFTGKETDTGGGTTDFVVDDTALNQAT
ncbi:MAG TPA: putative Ig domain-containing protein, partial [Acidimicrobiales bacterium]|nr:putative Ig domain-containing protein [Acidimicrobiales bacterium]